MDKKKSCSVCNIKIDKDNYKKDRTVCKDCYKIKKKENTRIKLHPKSTTIN